MIFFFAGEGGIIILRTMETNTETNKVIFALELSRLVHELAIMQNKNKNKNVVKITCASAHKELCALGRVGAQ